MSKASYTPEEMEEIRELVPPHLHKWLDYEIVPELDNAPTPGEALNEVPLLKDVPGSHSRFPASYFKEPEKAPKKAKAAPLIPMGEIAPKATLNPKPGLNAKKTEAAVDPQKSLLDLALGDGE
jgi:hypothetical protein